MKGHFLIYDLDDNQILVTFKVVGTTFHQNEVDELLMKAMPDFSYDENGQQEMVYNYSIDLITEPDNQYDHNAVYGFFFFLSKNSFQVFFVVVNIIII